MSKIKSDLEVRGNITISGTPTNPDHVATKDYVDSSTPVIPPAEPLLENDVIAYRIFG